MFNYPKTKNNPIIPDKIYRTPIITFGGSFKYLSPNLDLEEWEEWKNKFEALISKMYWHKVILHAINDRSENSFCKWSASYDNIMNLAPNNPITKWSFELKESQNE